MGSRRTELVTGEVRVQRPRGSASRGHCRRTSPVTFRQSFCPSEKLVRSQRVTALTRGRCRPPQAAMPLCIELMGRPKKALTSSRPERTMPGGPFRAGRGSTTALEPHIGTGRCFFGRKLVHLLGCMRWHTVNFRSSPRSAFLHRAIGAPCTPASLVMKKRRPTRSPRARTRARAVHPPQQIVTFLFRRLAPEPSLPPPPPCRRRARWARARLRARRARRAARLSRRCASLRRSSRGREDESNGTAGERAGYCAGGRTDNRTWTPTCRVARAVWRLWPPGSCRNCRV